MADPFVAEIRIVGFNFPPKGWAACNGQLLPISQNTALFSLLGTVYGGDGKSTFALPDLEGMGAMHPGQGSGLSLRDLGQIGGAQFVTLLQSEMPVHTHALNAQVVPASTGTPSANATFARSAGGSAYKAAGGPTGQMAPQTLAPTGGSLPHNNMMPYLTMNYIIAMQGVFPPRP
jgi:microcystin-dependent protein